MAMNANRQSVRLGSTSTDSSLEDMPKDLPGKGRWGGPSSRRLRGPALSNVSTAFGSDSSDEDKCPSTAKASTHAGLSGAESASDDERSSRAQSNQWSSAGESESEGEGKASEAAESFCSAIDVDDSDLSECCSFPPTPRGKDAKDDGDLSECCSFPPTPRGKDAKAQGCVFSVATLLQLRAAMLCHYGPNWNAPQAGSLRCQPCPTEASAESSRAVERCHSGPVSSPTAWKPTRVQNLQGTSEDGNLKVARAARAVLNKLTVEKFDQLYEQLVTCGLRTPEHIAILMREVFEKATAQHHFISMYADLCARLESDPRVAAALGTVEEAQRSSFKRLLLDQCQTSFEELLEPEPAREAPQSEEEAEAAEEARLLKKQRKLGNVKLVGELLLRGMLHSQLLCTCLEELLGSWEKCPEVIESLAALLTVVGAKFDVETWQYRAQLTSLFQQISDLATSGKLPARLRFLLKDVLELRSAGWQQRTKAGPMRINEVRSAACSSPASSASSSPKSVSSLCLPQSKQIPAASAQQDSRRALMHLSEICKDRGRALPSSAQAGALMRLSEICKASNGAVAASKGAAAGQSNTSSAPFSLAAFHKVLSAALRDLRTDRNCAAAVKKIRAEKVPRQYQAREFTDLITRISEDSSGTSRRVALAFLIELCSSQDSAFEREECIKGAAVFFREVYADLRKEVPRLSLIMTSELLPMLRKAWLHFELDSILPQKELRLK